MDEEFYRVTKSAWNRLKKGFEEMEKEVRLNEGNGSGNRKAR